MMREKLVQLTVTLVVTGYSDIQQPVAIAELYACRRGDAVAAAFTHEIRHAGSVVDIVV